MDEDFDLRIMSAGVWRRIWLKGRQLDGPWKFVSDGTIGAYPRFVDMDGVTVPWHAVTEAQR